MTRLHVREHGAINFFQRPEGQLSWLTADMSSSGFENLGTDTHSNRSTRQARGAFSSHLRP